MAVQHPYLIVVQGAPGVGKTTIAQRLATDLGINYFSKDSFKEMLYDVVGLPESTEVTKIYGRIAIRAMYAAADEYVKAGKNVIIEAPLEARFAVDDLAKICKSNDTVQLHVFCDPEIQARRFRERAEAGDRHVGHADMTMTADEACRVQQRNGPLPGFVTIAVDTTVFSDTDYQTVLAKLKKEIT